MNSSELSFNGGSFGPGKYRNKTSLTELPSLPNQVLPSSSTISEHSISQEDKHEPEPETSYVEFDLSGMANRNSTSDSLGLVTEKTINRESPINIHKQEELDNTPIKVESEPIVEEDDDFFNTASDWKAMKTIADLDYYNDKGELEYSNHVNDSNPNKQTYAYTKIDTEEQVNKYSEMDQKTDFLFRSRKDNANKPQAAYQKEDLEYDSEEDDQFVDEDNVDSEEALQGTKNMLTESQKFAYLGITKLLTVEMATELAKLQIGTSDRIAKQMSLGQRNFSNWTMYVMTELYSHLDANNDEKKMIENLSIHGLEVTDLSNSLKEVGSNAKIRSVNNQIEADFDLRWVIICDLFLELLKDGYYDCRSRTLLKRFAKTLGIQKVELLQFERRLIDSLELETKEKSIENKDELLNDKSFINKHIKKNRRRRLAYIGLATLGGSLAIGLSAGLLAPVIGAGLAAGLTTVGITGTTGFLAGIGGSVIITTGGVVAGAKVGSKAGARRSGDVQTFQLKPLHNNKRTNLIITVSGWMNGALDDVRLPFSTVDPIMGDMFSLLWEPEMLQSMGQTITILASEALSTSIQQILGATILTALMAAIQLPMALSKLSYLLDNPWNVSLDRAWKAGKILADTLIAGNVGVRPITLVGFSLGARLIYSCLIELAKRGGYGLIENVILLGNPISVKDDQLALARSIVSGRFINGYSTKDWVLGYLFRATGGGLSTVAGLSPITSVNNIENIDCTNLVEGHMSYRKAIPKILKLMDWEVLSEEFAEIEEPDPEQSERARKLVSEFDEARAKMKEEMNSEAQPKGWKKWFKPKNRDWWETVGKAEAEKEGNSNKSSIDEYEVEEGDTTMSSDVVPVFDLQALQNEINDIGKLAGEDEKELEKARTELEPPKPELVTNEVLEDVK
ncbi:hypothetical protein DFJ63DRAFT_332658 [Scheffersomyces coipomensis]|uniref:uncharacterized protein n=1 Tax=Scheffersomyces coipomensis TaxID=1788519 RepID=UPI00315CC21E